MAKILLDYVFPISVIESIPQASTAFLRQAALVVKPKAGQEGNVGTLTQCVNMSEVAALTNNTEAQQLFDAGMNRVYILLADDLDLAEYLETHSGEFFTLLISSDFSDEDVGFDEAVAASGEVEITSYADLLNDTPDTIEVAGVTFTAQSGAANPGDPVFQAETSNEATAQSLADQINNHATANQLVEAEAEDGVVTITALEPGADGNSLTLAYTDNDGGGTSIGATVTGSGTLEGGKDANPAMTLGGYEGVTGVASDDPSFAAMQAAINNRVGFYKKTATGAKNMLHAFGSLLSNLTNWNNQQFITMPFDDEVDELGTAESFFDDRVSFVIQDEEFGNRLALFAAGGKAIIAPYILKNLRIDLQSRALQWIAANQPQYTIKEASLLEARLQEDVINSYIERGWLESGTIRITLEQQNFVASGNITVPTPKALWRVFNEMVETN